VTSAGTEDRERQALVRFIEDAFVCAQACEECAAACLPPLEAGEPESWTRLEIRCADVCERTGRMLARNPGQDAAVLRSQVEQCALVCRSHAELLAQAAESDESARERADSCLRCERACIDFLRSLG
jgi:hypothetical protein